MDKIDPEWWKRLFDQTYLITDARSVCDEHLTCREVDFLQDFLQLQKEHAILDLCGGQGRHALELSRRGFQDVTVLDYSPFLVGLGKKRAHEENLKISFIQQDARNTTLPNERFRTILVMASSFGYFLEKTDDEKMLLEAFRLLQSRGSLLLDLPNKRYIMENFIPLSWHEADEHMVVCRHRRMDSDMVYTRELVVSKIEGLVRDACYCTRLYSREQIVELLNSAGFSSVRVQEDFVSHEQREDYGFMTNRMIVTAKKRQAEEVGVGRERGNR
jgi:D-alanine-D-alanine ligase